MARQEVLALFSYAAKRDVELTFEKNDVFKLLEQDPSGWWKGERAGRVGVFPRNFVTLVENKERAVGLHPYQSEDKKYLSFAKGEIINILVRDSSGWWRAQNARGHTGLVPRNYVRILVEGEDPQLAQPQATTTTSPRAEGNETKTVEKEQDTKKEDTKASTEEKKEGEKTEQKDETVEKDKDQKQKEEETQQISIEERDRKLQELVKIEDEFKKEFAPLKSAILEAHKSMKNIYNEEQEARQQALEKVEELLELVEEIEI